MGRCKFLSDWLERKDSSGCRISAWGKRRGESDLFCILCEVTITTAKGFYAIKQHYETDKHKKNNSVKNNPCQLQLLSTGERSTDGLQLFSKKDAAYSAELIWCLRIVAYNMSANSCQDIGKDFKAMFTSPGAVPDNFCLNPTKVRYLLSYSLGPYFRTKFLQEASRVYYTLSYDETTNNAGVKELQTSVRFWSNIHNEVTSHHLETFYMGHATAKDLKENILAALHNAGLPIAKLLMLASDGPNVNKKVFTIMNEAVKNARQKSLLDIGFCIVHTIHNAFQKGIEELGVDASQLIVNVYSFFHDVPARWEDFSNIMFEKDLQDLHFLKHVSTRWLTIGPAARRLLQLWDCVVEYFLKYIPMKQCRMMETTSYKKIVTLLRKKTIKAELYFICSSSTVFTKFTGTFQKEEPLIHVLHESVKDIMLTIMGRVCKPQAIKHFNQNMDDDPFNEKRLLEVKDLPLSDEILSSIAHLKKSEKHEFVLNIQKHYVTAGKYIMGKNILQSKILKSFSCLKPAEVKSQKSIKKLKTIANCLPVELDEERLVDEWKVLQLENVEHEENIRIDHYWAKLTKLRTTDGSLKYPNVLELAKAVLSLSHGSADVERGFSRSARIMTEDKASMCSRTLNARLNVADGLKRYNNKPHLVPITEELLKSARLAYKNYNDYLENEKKKAEEEKRQKKKDHEDILIEKERMKKLEESKITIETLKTQLKAEKGSEHVQTSAVEQLMGEAHSKLKTALAKNDLTGAKVAEAMLEGAMRTNTECKKKNVWP